MSPAIKDASLMIGSHNFSPIGHSATLPVREDGVAWLGSGPSRQLFFGPAASRQQESVNEQVEEARTEFLQNR